MTLNCHSVQEVITRIVEEVEPLGADSNDTNGIIRQVIAERMPDRRDVWFDVWFCVCCDLADRSAMHEGYKNSADRAYTLATQKLAANRA